MPNLGYEDPNGKNTNPFERTIKEQCVLSDSSSQGSGGATQSPLRGFKRTTSRLRRTTPCGMGQYPGSVPH